MHHAAPRPGPRPGRRHRAQQPRALDADSGEAGRTRPPFVKEGHLLRS